MEKQKKKETWTKTGMYKTTSKVREIEKYSLGKQNGITLIALVISIIVMLILAGVSLNMTVGENGIITKAQQASYQTGIAVLEEWLQQEYVQYYNNENEYVNKAELLSAKKEGLFLKQGSNNYITSSLDGTGIKRYYLLNKLALPKEISSSLVGGDTTEYADYINFIDVYGITEDLKVYYCKNGLLENVLGIVGGTEVSPDIKLTKINADSGIKSAVAAALGLDENADITVGDIQSLKTLTLNNPSIKSLSALTETYNLKSLTLEGLTLSNLSGLESCNLLETIYFKSTIVGDYTALSSNYKLNSLYMYLNPDWVEKTCNDQVSYLCDGLSHASRLSQLKYLGISGDTDLLENPNNYRTNKINKRRIL